MGQTLTRVIFSALRNEAEKHSGQLTIEDIHRIEEAFTQIKGVMSPHYMETYNFCVDAAADRKPASFDNDDPLDFYLLVRSQGLVTKVFSRQIQHGGNKLRSAFCRRLGAVVREAAGSEIDEEFTAVYFDLAGRRGRELTASDILEDVRGTVVLRAAFDKLNAHRRQNSDVSERLRRRLNEDVLQRVPDAAAIDAFVTAQQVEAFLDEVTDLFRASPATPHR